MSATRHATIAYADLPDTGREVKRVNPTRQTVHVFRLRYPDWQDRREALRIAFAVWLATEDCGLTLA